MIGTQWIVRCLLLAWAGTMVVVGASLMVSHWIPLPKPDSEKPLPAEALLWHKRGDWTAYHFLYLDCPCSRRVLDHLLTSSVHRQVAEHLVLVGNDTAIADRARQRGYSVEQISPQDLYAVYGVEAAPLMVVVDPRGQTRYSGGYTSRKQVLNVKRGEILERLLGGDVVENLPLFGCAVSNRLQSLTDPLGLKYSSAD